MCPVAHPCSHVTAGNGGLRACLQYLGHSSCIQANGDDAAAVFGSCIDLVVAWLLSWSALPCHAMQMVFEV
jgi:hypothetical protein